MGGSSSKAEVEDRQRYDRHRRDRVIYQAQPKLRAKEFLIDIPESYEFPGTFQMYQVHDGEKRPFRVFVDEAQKIAVLTSTSRSTCINKLFHFERLFIGKSPKNRLTSSEGTHGPAFDGNTLLFLMDRHRHQYLYVGPQVYMFHSQVPIVKYVSAVTDDDRPYPYAVDQDGDFYFLADKHFLDGHRIRQKREPFEELIEIRRRRPSSIREIEVASIVG